MDKDRPTDVAPSALENRIFEEVVAFYEDCEVRKSNLADTWVHSLQRKGRRYGPEEMLAMRRPGSFVTLHINIFDYFLDKTRLDLGNPIVKTLVERGESPIGRPMLDMSLDGQGFTSVYVKHMDIAAKIIAHLQRKGVTHPTVLEIGGGQGLLLAALREWYGDRLTVLTADIPETLFYQAYFLRASFPGVPFTYKPGATNVEPIPGGFNFINAFELLGQDYSYDVAINNNSMQEMTAEVANSYLDYFDRTIGDNGTLFFRNAYGHALGSVVEPSDYRLGTNWRLVDANFGDYFTNSSATQFGSFVFDRTDEALDPDSLRLILRVLWSGFAAGLLTPGGVTANSIIALGGRNDPVATAKQLAALLPATGALWVDRLTQGPRLDSMTCAVSVPPLDLRSGAPHWQRLAVIRQLQKQLAEEMAASQDRPVASTAARLRGLVADAVADAAVAGFVESDYWSGYIAAIGTGLKLTDITGPLVERRLAASDNPYWRLRFAWLLAQSGQNGAARSALSGTAIERLDPFWSPMAALLHHQLGHPADAARLLDRTAGLAGKQGSDELRHCLFRVNLRTGRLDQALSMFPTMEDENLPRRADAHLRMLVALLRRYPEEVERAKPLLAVIQPAPGPSSTLADLLYRLGRIDEADGMFYHLTRDAADSYYALAGIGRALLALQRFDEAECCMVRSAELRPGTIQHLDFLANACFEAGRFNLARRWFEELTDLKTYDDISRGRAGYANLTTAVRDSGIFGAVSDQALIFQAYQSFYYPDGPQIR